MVGHQCTSFPFSPAQSEQNLIANGHKVIGKGEYPNGNVAIHWFENDVPKWAIFYVSKDACEMVVKSFNIISEDAVPPSSQ